jgi:hypothetical protein
LDLLLGIFLRSAAVAAVAKMVVVPVQLTALLALPVAAVA